MKSWSLVRESQLGRGGFNLQQRATPITPRNNLEVFIVAVILGERQNKLRYRQISVKKVGGHPFYVVDTVS
jgi:hypothetical protein